MKVYISHLFDDQDLIRLLEEDESCKVGIESIEFSIGMCLDDVDDSIRSYRSRMGGFLEERPLSLHGPFLDLQPMSWDRLARDAARTRYEQVYEAAQKLEADRIVFHTCFMPYAIELGWAERMTDFWMDYLEDKKSGILIHMENVFDPHYRGSVKVAEAVRKEHPEFSLCLDTGHANCYGVEPFEEWMEAMGPYLGHFHLHNNAGDDDSHLPLNDGSIDCDWLMGELASRHKECGFTIENNTWEHCRASLEIMKNNNFF